MTKKIRYGVVNKDILLDPSLSMQAKAVYALLSIYADKTRTCYPSIKTLAEYLGAHRRTIERLIKELEEKNYVSRYGRKFILE
jgi:excisionase family DNA binding protein